MSSSGCDRPSEMGTMGISSEMTQGNGGTWACGRLHAVLCRTI